VKVCVMNVEEVIVADVSIMLHEVEDNAHSS